VALPHLGVISLAVLGAAFEAKRIGGDAPLESWVRKHAHQDRLGAAEMVSFYTVKRRELAELATERKAKKRRQRQRRNRAHEMRVERFTERTNHSAA
jgi:hypothetical protein